MRTLLLPLLPLSSAIWDTSVASPPGEIVLFFPRCSARQPEIGRKFPGGGWGRTGTADIVGSGRLKEGAHACRHVPAMEISALLRRMVELGGSDLHLKVGSVPHVRVDGVLTPTTDTAALEPTDTESFAADLIPPQKSS